MSARLISCGNCLYVSRNHGKYFFTRSSSDSSSQRTYSQSGFMAFTVATHCCADSDMFVPAGNHVWWMIFGMEVLSDEMGRLRSS